MLVDSQPFHTIWIDSDHPELVRVIDQRLLPHKFEVRDLHTVDDACHAIKDMVIRGAPLIGVTASYGVYLATLAAKQHNHKELIRKAICDLASTRPTAVNLQWALKRMEKVLTDRPSSDLSRAALMEAECIKQEDIAMCQKIGEHGLPLIREIAEKKGRQPVNILTHCNAGWLACVDWGTATSPIYHAHQAGIDLHVWVDETRPRNQGASLTAFEFVHEKIPHTLIADNTGGHLMQHGMIDLVIVGADRITSQGDAANKIGTYLKALAAQDNRIPFYVAAPSSTIDWELKDGLKEIPIEQRDPDEVRYVQGLHDNKLQSVLICPEETPAANYGFDVTPARLISGIITERGISKADATSLRSLFA